MWPSAVLHVSLLLAAAPRVETILQYFQTPWSEISERMPEIARIGYTALWLPPPTKGAEGAIDVGFSVYDRFDLGDRDQRGTIATKYGTRTDLVRLVAEAHRFGIKVYFDTVMNHNANPGLTENPQFPGQPVPLDGFPGTHPLDYHVLPARNVGGGTWEVKNPAMFGGNIYVLAPNATEGEAFVPVITMPSGMNVPGFTHVARAPWIDFSTAGLIEQQYLSLLGLADFAIEQVVTPSGSGPAPMDGTNLVAEQPLPRYVRLPDRPETYPGSTPVPEDIREFMMRWVKWLGDVTDCDGLRLDAIKHVPTTFYARDFAGDPIAFNAEFQDNLDERRGWVDTEDDDGTEDALLFGESFTGDFDSLQSYRQTGMYLLDFPLLFRLATDGGVFAKWGEGDIGQLSFPQGGMNGLFHEFGGLGRTAGVSFVQSHDTAAPTAQPNAAYAFALSRVGHTVVYYDGNHHDPSSWVRPGRVDALGELGSSTIKDLVEIRKRFARGGMFNRFVDSDAYVFERVVETPSGTGGATLLVALTDKTTEDVRFGEFDPRPLIVTEFPPGTVLQELTGNGALSEVTVLDPGAVSVSERNEALAEFDRSSDPGVPNGYGLVYLQVPSGPNVGYVAYAPRTPPISLEITSMGEALTERVITTAPNRRTPAGAPIPPATISVGVVRGTSRLTLRAFSDPTAERADLKIDGGANLPGLSPTTGSSDVSYEGFYEMSKEPAASAFTLSDVDLSTVGEGVHLVTVRVSLPGAPVFFSEATVPIVIDRSPIPDGGLPEPDGGVEDASGSSVDGGVDVDPDPDRDGVPDEIDLCPEVADPEQGDFDGDRVGDGCDLCPSSAVGPPVDAIGCALVSDVARAALDAIVDLILEERYEAQHDVNGDGSVSALDFVLRAKEVTP